MWKQPLRFGAKRAGPLFPPRRAVALALAAMLLAAPALAAPAAPPTVVFAAASLKNCLDDVAALYAARTGAKASISYAASSLLARQIEQGAPADIFISADSDWMDYLATRKLIVAASRRDLLTNHLALIAPADSKIALRIAPGMPLSRALGDGRLAVAGPRVPAGKYAKASLVALGLWPSVENRLAPAADVRGALAFVASGGAPLGIVYDTDAKVEPKVRIVGLFPDPTHPKIVYPAAVVSASRDPGARAFFAFLFGPRAAAVFHRYGFARVR